VPDESKIDNPVNGAHANIYEGLAHLSGQLEGVDARVLELRDDYRDLIKALRESTANCVAHLQRTADLERKVALLPTSAVVTATALTPKAPSSTGLPSVSKADLDQRFEETERTVTDELNRGLEAKVTAGVVAELNRRRDEEQRVAAERRELTRREEEAKAATLAAEVARKAEVDKARWARVQWIVGVIVAILGSGTAASWCSVNARLDTDRAALVKALQAQPKPVVKVIEVPTPAPSPPTDP
jgi:hypothetical protein